MRMIFSDFFKRFCLISAFVMSVFLFSSCAIFGERPLSMVNDSQLNWMTIRYYPADKTQKPSYYNIIGVGSIEYKEGLSPLVFDPFSQDVDNPNWRNIETEKLGITPKQAQWIMQMFVDGGLMTEGKRLKKLSKAERDDKSHGLALFSAKLNAKPYGISTNNPKLIELIETIRDAIVSNRGFR